MTSFELIEHKLLLKTTWSISRESSEFKINFIVKAKMGSHFGLGECAISARYNQTHDKIRSEFKKFVDAKLSIDSPVDLVKLNGLNLSSALRFAIESSLVHLWSAQKKESVSHFLGLKEVDSITTSYSIPIMELNKIAKYLEENPFACYKLKVGKENGKELLNAVLKHSTSQVRVDANEAFDSVTELMDVFDNVDMTRVEFVEQPFASENLNAYKELFKINPFKVMADEAFIDERDYGVVRDHFHMVNLKLMKVGSYYKTIELARELKKMGLELMIGCMIETSVGIRSALNIASLFDVFDLDGSLLLKSDPYDFIKSDQDKICLN